MTIEPAGLTFTPFRPLELMMNLKNMKVRTRLAAGFALILVLLAATVAVGLVYMKQMREQTAMITDLNNFHSFDNGSVSESRFIRPSGSRSVNIGADRGIS